jgi:hypothetical protein
MFVNHFKELADNQRHGLDALDLKNFSINTKFPNGLKIKSINKKEFFKTIFSARNW